MATKCKAFGQTASVADTKTQIGSDYTLPSGTRKITALHMSIFTLVKAEAPAGYITLEIDTVNGPFEFPIPIAMITGTSGTEAAWGSLTKLGPIPVDIPVPGAGVCKLYVTLDAALEVYLGLQFE